MADYLAKTVITIVRVSIHHVSLPRFSLKSKVTEWAMKEWKEQWNHNDVSRLTYEDFPKVSLKPAGWPRELTIFISENGSFPVYLKRITRHPEKNCAYGKLRNPFHYATECHLTESFHFTKPTEVNRVVWMRAAARNKLSRNRISACEIPSRQRSPYYVKISLPCLHFSSS
ncbi:hypothetical protein AVEN_153027-1 [Araneus ventricosus]|uniref:Uncharacterized protein n=1 Tax=Araneus ventricosus TaxID=182803 RepID=A0A4Y2NCH9_ARAVE|nr:hypothetical protein AVEN_153027-1 [Araneus ventricosus]